jgi:hypothetical protein
MSWQSIRRQCNRIWQSADEVSRDHTNSSPRKRGEERRGTGQEDLNASVR